MGKRLSQARIKLLWVPEGGIANFHAPTVAELTAGTVIDMSCMVGKSNYLLGASGDESISDPALCDEGNTSVPGNTNYEAGMDFFRYETNLEDIPWNTFTEKGIDGYWVERRGKRYSDPIVATDVVKVMQVISGTPRDLPVPENGGYDKFRVDYFPQSQVYLRAVVAAA